MLSRTHIMRVRRLTDVRTLGAALAMLCALRTAAAADCADRWETRAPMGLPRQEIGVAAIGDRLYAVGGFDPLGAPSAAAEAYDTTVDRWTPIAPLPAALHHVAAAAVDTTLYAIGGLATLASTATDSVFAYDPAHDAWQARAPLPAPRGAMGAAVIAGRIYVAGGRRAGASVADFAVYDPALDQWTPLASMPTARDHLAVAALGDVFYAVGGRAGQLFGALEAFDPASGGWRTDLAPMPTPRGGLMASAVGGFLFAFGGEGNPSDPLGIFRETEAYDVAADRWTALDPMPVPRHGTVAAAIGGAIHVPGGGARQGLGVSAVHEVFVPSAPAAIRIKPARLRNGRLRLRGRIEVPGADAAVVPVTLRLTSELGVELTSLALPVGGLDARGRRLRYRAPRGTRGIVRLRLLRPPDGSLAVRLQAVLAAGASAPAEVTLTLGLGDALHCGSAPARRRRPAASVQSMNAPLGELPPAM